MSLNARHVDADAHIIVNGRRVDGTVNLQDDEMIRVEFTERPALGMNLLQLQTRGGLISNDFIFYTTLFYLLTFFCCCSRFSRGRDFV